MITMTLLTCLAIVVAAWMAHRSGEAGGPAVPAPSALVGALDSRWILAAVFGATVAVIWYAWGRWSPFPAVHDEMAYVLQSQILAQGRWSNSSPPIPEFFEQPHVLVVPSVTAKYFPGHALALVPSALLGWAPLGPLMLQGLTGALVFALARRVASGAVALLTWLLWLTTPVVLYFAPSYYSEGTTVLCWVGGWYALLRWRASRDWRWLCVVALATGWCAITRPLTGVAYAIPVGIVVLRDVARGRHWRQLGGALALGISVLAIVPLWSARTTGSWRLTPQALYTRQYMPYDVPGFGLVTTPSTRQQTRDLAQLNASYSWYHRDHFVHRLPEIARRRAVQLALNVWGSSGLVLMLFAAAGLCTRTWSTGFAALSALSLVGLYLLYATPSGWTLYYIECIPALAYVTAVGLAWACSHLCRPVWALGRQGWRSARLAPALAAASALLVLPAIPAVQYIRGKRVEGHEPQRRFAEHVRGLPGERAVVFVRYAPDHSPHVAFVHNPPDPERERVWVAHDRGDAENARLLRLAPGRRAYLFDEARGTTYLYRPLEPSPAP